MQDVYSNIESMLMVIMVSKNTPGKIRFEINLLVIWYNTRKYMLFLTS
jgi:hypothetical protein